MIGSSDASRCRASRRDDDARGARNVSNFWNVFVTIARATFMATRTDIVARSDAQRANARTAARLARHCPPETPNVKPGEEIVREG